MVDEAGPSLRTAVLDGSAINGVDLAACGLLSELKHDLQARGIGCFLEISVPAFGTGRARWEDAESDDGLFYPSVRATVTAVT